MSDSDTHPAALDALRRTRDELRLQLHLAGAELQEEWQKAEVQWGRIEGELHRLQDVSSAPTHHIRKAVDELVGDVGQSYTRIIEALRRPV